ncbi:hypothetical protein [Aurantibacter sp.]|uniref:hypothetical protein n=1 Tax=Aurantibacter sp. TaxID=2807103 RepID=UPI0032658933
MQDINTIYHNGLGVAFQWKNNPNDDNKKVQIVFRDTGLLLTREQLSKFSKNINFTRENSSLCKDCAEKESCRVLLVESPIPSVTFALNARELNEIQDLVDGTLFQLDLDIYVNKMCGQ